VERRECEQVSLLFWQRCLVFYIIGIWTYKFSAPGLCSAFLAFIFLAPRKLLHSLFLILFFLAGLGIAHLVYPRPPIKIPAPILRGQKVYFAGKIAKITSLPDHKLRLFIENVQIFPHSYSPDFSSSQKQPLPARLLLTWENPHTWPLPGQEISGRLRIKPVHGLVNEGCWNSEFYWHRQKVYFRGYYFDKNSTRSSLTLTPTPSPTLRNILRQKIIHIFDKYFPDKPRIKGLALALLMNDKYFLGSKFVDQVRLSSLGHTLALSGLHLGLIICLGFCLSYLIGLVCPYVYLYLPRPKLGIILAVPLVCIYLWLGQAPVSLLRASIMFFSWAILYLKNRNRIFIDGLFYALLLIVVVSPLSIFDLSLQLSFVAVFFIGVTYPHWRSLFSRLSLFDKLRRERRLRGLWGYLSKPAQYFIALIAMTLTANLGLLPLQAWAFGRFSPHIYLNLIWLPVLGFLVLPAGFMGVLLIFVPLLENLSQYFFYLMGIGLKGLIVVLDFFQVHDLLHPIVIPRPGWEQMLGFWFVLLVFIYHSRLWQQKTNFFLAMSLIALINILSITLNQFNCIKLKLLDVGQGQSILCELPGNKRILIDGGGSWSLKFDPGKYIVTPVITWKAWPRLDRVFLTHSDVDHLRGLYYPLSYLKVDEFVFNGVYPEGRDKQLLARALSLGGEKVRVTGRGDVWDMGQGVKIFILHPSRDFVTTKNNNRSLVMLLKWKNRNLALISGDIEKEGIKHLLDYDDVLHSDVLIVPHHGSRTSFSTEFYKRVKPEIALISAGFLNKFHLPHKKVVNYLKKMGCRVFNTATHGEIQVVWSSWNKPAQVVLSR